MHNEHRVTYQVAEYLVTDDVVPEPQPGPGARARRLASYARPPGGLASRLCLDFLFERVRFVSSVSFCACNDMCSEYRC